MLLPREIAKRPWRDQLRLRKDLKNGSLSKSEDGVKLGAHERQGQLAKGSKRQHVFDEVTNTRRAGVHLVKDVMMHPFFVRAFELLINKLGWRVPATDSRPPSQWQTVKEDRVVNQCSFLHANWQRREDLESKGRRCDSYQIGGIREERKNLSARDSNDRLSLEQMFKQGAGRKLDLGWFFPRVRASIERLESCFDLTPAVLKEGGK